LSSAGAACCATTLGLPSCAMDDVAAPNSTATVTTAISRTAYRYDLLFSFMMLSSVVSCWRCPWWLDWPRCSRATADLHDERAGPPRPPESPGQRKRLSSRGHAATSSCLLLAPRLSARSTSTPETGVAASIGGVERGSVGHPDVEPVTGPPAAANHPTRRGRRRRTGGVVVG